MKPWAHMREHGPCMIFGWYATRNEAESAIDVAAEQHGEQVRGFHTIAYFPRRAAGGVEEYVPASDEESTEESLS